MVTQEAEMLTCVFSILLSQQAANPPSEKASTAQRDQRKTSSWVSHPYKFLGGESPLQSPTQKVNSIHPLGAHLNFAQSLENQGWC